MNLDQLIIGLPVIGVWFEKTYAFWQIHVALANLTHFALGVGVALLVTSKRKKIGAVLMILTAVIHVFAFFN